jgi:hypothetical protein
MPSLPLILRDIILLRRGPQDLPFSERALLVTAVLLVVFAGLINAVQGDSSGMAMVRSAVGIGLSLGVLYLVLLSKQFQARFVQTGLASLLVAAVAAALLLPVLLAAGPLPGPDAKPESLGGAQVLSILLFSVIGLWKFVVDAHIVRHALEIRFLLALPITFAMDFAVAVFIVALFGQPAAGA